MIVSELQSFGDVFFEAPEVFTDALSDRLESLKAVGRLGGVNAHTLARAVVDRDKHGGSALVDRGCHSQVGAPHLIGLLGRNRAIVGSSFATPS